MEVSFKTAPCILTRGLFLNNLKFMNNTFNAVLYNHWLGRYLELKKTNQSALLALQNCNMYAKKLIYEGKLTLEQHKQNKNGMAGTILCSTQGEPQT